MAIKTDGGSTRYRYPTQANPPDNPGEWNQFGAVTQVNRLDADGNDIEDDLLNATNVPMRFLSTGGYDDEIVVPVIDYAGNGHVRLNDTGTDFAHTFSGELTVGDLTPGGHVDAQGVHHGATTIRKMFRGAEQVWASAVESPIVAEWNYAEPAGTSLFLDVTGNGWDQTVDVPSVVQRDGTGIYITANCMTAVTDVGIWSQVSLPFHLYVRIQARATQAGRRVTETFVNPADTRQEWFAWATASPNGTDSHRAGGGGALTNFVYNQPLTYGVGDTVEFAVCGHSIGEGARHTHELWQRVNGSAWSLASYWDEPDDTWFARHATRMLPILCRDDGGWLFQDYRLHSYLSNERFDPT